MLTNAQEAQIRLYLGYPDMNRYRHSRLESVMDSLSPDAEAQITTIFTALATVETAIIDGGIDAAGIKRVDEIWFENGRSRMAGLRSAGRMYVSRLSIITGVPIYSDVFGSSGYLGDSFLPGNGQGTGGGFYNLG